MVSDYINEHDSFLKLTCEEEATFPTTARVLLEYGAEKEGYWNSEKFMKNVGDAARIAKFKYPQDKNTIIFVIVPFQKMNVKPGGNQPCMRDTVWAGRTQKMVDGRGVPKGIKKVLEERGINTSSLIADDMRTILSNHEDFGTEQTIVEHFLEKEGLEGIFLPKFHCELNPIERVWGQAKVYTRAHTNFTFVRLRNIIDPGLDSVSVDLIRGK